MSITFSFQNDDKVIHVYDCCCAQDGEAYTACWECKGSGKVEICSQANEVNLSNTNAYSLMKLVGLEPDYCGSFAPTWDMYHKVMVLWANESDDYWRMRLKQFADLLFWATYKKADEIIFG